MCLPGVIIVALAAQILSSVDIVKQQVALIDDIVDVIPILLGIDNTHRIPFPHRFVVTQLISERAGSIKDWIILDGRIDVIVNGSSSGIKLCFCIE